MKRGDILLVSYKYDPMGWFIRKVTHSKWNHVAWALNEYSIMEVKLKGIVVSPVTEYLNKRCFNYKLIRLKIKKSKLEWAIKDALKRKCKYNHLKLWTVFLMILFKSKKPLPRPTCSGFIAESLARIGWYFSKKPPSIVTPQDIDNSKKVRTITNELRCFNTNL